MHRDIKPGNLLLDGRERLAVADFGIARLAWEDQLTATGQVLGTAAYLSPEQAMGEAATAASDRYALAVVAYELLTGTRPFEAEHFAAQARAHVEDPVPAASSRATSDLSPAVDAVLERGLAKDPGDRWGSSLEFVEALERTLAQEAPEPTRPTRRVGKRGTAVAPVREKAPRERAAASPPPGARRREAAVADDPGRRRSSAAPLLIGLAAIALIAVIGAVALASRGNDTPHAPRRSTAEPAGTASPEKTEEPKPTDTPTEEPTERSRRPSPRGPRRRSRPPARPRGDPGGGVVRATRHSCRPRVTGFSRAGTRPARFRRSRRPWTRARGSAAIDPCAYAMYDYGDALYQAGRPDEAVTVLEARLDRFDNQNDTVKALLKKARKAAKE